MEPVVIAILVFVAVMVISTLAFGGWLIVSVLRLLGRGIGALLGINRAGPPMLPPPPPHTVRCGFEKCRAINADRARFCRRCGKVLGTAGRHAVAPPRRAERQVAMW